MEFDLNTFKGELDDELENILSYWMQHTIDAEQGGFIGQIDEHNNPNPLAAKGSVLNSRILWSFAAAFNHTHQSKYLLIAHRAYDYLVPYFLDKSFGGVYWTVDYQGNPLDTKKQVYAIAFTLYAFSEYYKSTKDERVLLLAIELFQTIEDKSFDSGAGGYIDAFDRNWKSMEDIRLSAKDANEKKTMNTHLHILEAYTSLYIIWPDKKLKEKLIGLVHNFFAHFIDRNTGHLILFFDEHWNAKPGAVSYGHDIEASWLLLEAADALGEEVLIRQAQKEAITIAMAAVEGLDTDGGLWYEYETVSSRLIREKHWWPQAEAMVGFLNAFQVSGKKEFLQRSRQSWIFIKKYLKDPGFGEWYWGIDEYKKPMRHQDKTGLWKCPYHNTRACLEGIRRIQIIMKDLNMV